MRQTLKQTERTGADAAQGKLIKKKELAVLLGWSPRRIETAMRARQIPFLRLASRTVRFDWTEVRRALDDYRIDAVGSNGGRL